MFKSKEVKQKIFFVVGTIVLLLLSVGKTFIDGVVVGLLLSIVFDNTIKLWFMLRKPKEL